MREMRDSGIEWIGEIPKGWEVTRAKNIFTQSFEKGNESLELLSATQENGVVPKTNLEGVVQVSEEADLNKFKTVHINDFVISLRSFQGGFEMSNYEGVITPAYSVFRSKTEINHRYYWQLFKSNGFISKINSLTVGIREGKNIYFEDFSEIGIPFPKATEQTAIANYLDNKCGKIDATIQREKQYIEKLKEYRQSVITEAVTKGLNPTAPMKDSGIEWIGEIPQEWATGKMLYALNMPITDGPHETPELHDKGIPFLSAEAVKNGKLDFNLRRGNISQEFYDICCKKYIPKINDIYMIKSGATTGNIAIVETDEIFQIWSPLAVFRAKDTIYFRFLYYYLQSDNMQKQIQLKWSYGTQQNIGMKVLEKLICVFPPLPLQTTIADYLDRKTAQIDSAIAKKETLIEKLTEYKKSLIYEAVTGKVEVSQ